jgi:hypothetical protein
MAWESRKSMALLVREKVEEWVEAWRKKREKGK